MVSHVYDFLSFLQAGAGLSSVSCKGLFLRAIGCSSSSCPCMAVDLLFVLASHSPIFEPLVLFSLIRYALLRGGNSLL